MFIICIVVLSTYLFLKHKTSKTAWNLTLVLLDVLCSYCTFKLKNYTLKWENLFSNNIWDAVVLSTATPSDRCKAWESIREFKSFCSASGLRQVDRHLTYEHGDTGGYRAGTASAAGGDQLSLEFWFIDPLALRKKWGDYLFFYLMTVSS